MCSKKDSMTVDTAILLQSFCLENENEEHVRDHVRKHVRQTKNPYACCKLKSQNAVVRRTKRVIWKVEERNAIYQSKQVLTNLPLLRVPRNSRDNFGRNKRFVKMFTLGIIFGNSGFTYTQYYGLPTCLYKK